MKSRNFIIFLLDYFSLPLTTRCIARISLLLRPTSSSSILKTRLNEGEHERRPTGYEEGSCASKLDSSSLHFSSPFAAIHYNTDPWNFFWLIIPGSRPTFAGPYFYIPVRTCLRENRYRFDSVPPSPPPPLLGGPKERSDLPFRIPESIYPVPNSLRTRIFGDLWNISPRSRNSFETTRFRRLDRFHEFTKLEIRSDMPIVREVGEGILEIFEEASL